MSKQFFQNFEKVSKKEWIEKATQDLKGTSPFDKFGWEIEPGLKVDPYYSLEDLNEYIEAFQNRLVENDHPSGSVRHWDNLQEITVHDEKKANKLALNALENGAEGIVFDLNKPVDFDQLLKNIELTYCSVWFKTDSSQETISQSLLNYFDGKALNGTIIFKDNNLNRNLVTAFQKLKNINLSGAVISNDLTFTEKISTLLVNTAKTAEACIDENLSADDFFSKQTLLYPLDTNFFGEIASLRALRQLYFQVAKAFDAKNFEPEHLHICAISKAWATDDYNPHANMLKGTTAGMAGILGGCNSLIVEPEDPSSNMMTRIARNVSSILKEESYLNSAVDPVAGSYYIESLSQSLAQEAWKKFQQKIK